MRLKVAPEQNGFVAPNAVSLGQALFEPRAWYRAIYLEHDVPGPGSPEAFYLDLGFRHTGRLDEGEVVLELPL